jgi:hypothetical protein
MQIVLFGAACREIAGLIHGRMRSPRGRSHGETVALVPPCRMVSMMLWPPELGGVLRDFCRLFLA